MVYAPENASDLGTQLRNIGTFVEIMMHEICERLLFAVDIAFIDQRSIKTKIL